MSVTLDRYAFIHVVIALRKAISGHSDVEQLTLAEQEAALPDRVVNFCTDNPNDPEVTRFYQSVTQDQNMLDFFVASIAAKYSYQDLLAKIDLATLEQELDIVIKSLELDQ